jgi:4,5-dihydroxyphthalate decarboxylase
LASKVRLKIAIAEHPHTAAIRNGSIPIEGVDAEFVTVKPQIGAFRRMVRDVEFDVCELAPTTYIIARAYGAPFVGLPVFVVRRFHHGGMLVRPDAGIQTPKDLEGKKVGVRAYSVTTGVWLRQVLIDEFGVDSSKVTWVVDDEEHVTQLQLPPNVVHAPEGSSLADMMARGELVAGLEGAAGIGRTGAPTGGWQEVEADYPDLLPNAAEPRIPGSRSRCTTRSTRPRRNGWRAWMLAKRPPPPTRSTSNCARSSATTRCPTVSRKTARPSKRWNRPRSSRA